MKQRRIFAAEGGAGERVYRIAVVRVELVRERSVPFGTRRISCPGDAAALAREILGDPDREHFLAVCLDIKNKVTAVNTVSIGSLNSSPVHPREVFKPAILANAAAVILVHNHPSGDPCPSREDVEVTGRLARAGEILGIAVLDHVVVGDGCFFSFKEKGLL